jgi:O-antigen/teichoic acid export membrane protein
MSQVDEAGFGQASDKAGNRPGETAVMSRLSLRRNFTWTLAGNMVYSICQWGMLVVIARLGSPEKVGLFALAFAVTGPLVMSSNLQLRVVQATDARGEFLFGHYLALRLMTITTALIAIVCISIILPFNLHTTMVILAVGVAKLIESASDVVYGLIQQHERMDRIAVSLMIRGPLSLLALGLGTYLTGSVFWGSVGMAAVWGIVLLTYDIPSGKLVLKNVCLPDASRFSPCWHYPTIKKLAIMSLPLGVTTMLSSFNTNAPRYFVEHYLGERELGIFAAMVYLMVTGTLVINALGHSAAPRLAKHFAECDIKTYRSLLLKLIGIGSVTGAVGVVVSYFFGNWILRVLYGPEYAAYSSVMVWIALVSWMAYVQTFLTYGMTTARRFNIQVPLLASATAVTTSICFLLVPPFGIYGAVWAMLGSTSVLVIGSLVANICAIRGLQKKGASDDQA